MVSEHSKRFETQLTHMCIRSFLIMPGTYHYEHIKNIITLCVVILLSQSLSVVVDFIVFLLFSLYDSPRTSVLGEC
jgi:hypothetical protein